MVSKIQSGAIATFLISFRELVCTPNLLWKCIFMCLLNVFIGPPLVMLIVESRRKLFVKCLKEGRNHGLILFWGNFLLGALYLVVYESLFWKLGKTFGTFHFHLSNFKRIWGSKMGLHRGLTILNPILVMQGYLYPPVLVRQARKLVSNSPTPLFVYDNLSTKKTCVTLCQYP